MLLLLVFHESRMNIFPPVVQGIIGEYLTLPEMIELEIKPSKQWLRHRANSTISNAIENVIDSTEKDLFIMSYDQLKTALIKLNNVLFRIQNVSTVNDLNKLYELNEGLLALLMLHRLPVECIPQSLIKYLLKQSRHVREVVYPILAQRLGELRITDPRLADGLVGFLITQEYPMKHPDSGLRAFLDCYGLYTLCQPYISVVAFKAMPIILDHLQDIVVLPELVVIAIKEYDAATVTILTQQLLSSHNRLFFEYRKISVNEDCLINMLHRLKEYDPNLFKHVHTHLNQLDYLNPYKITEL